MRPGRERAYFSGLTRHAHLAMTFNRLALEIRGLFWFLQAKKIHPLGQKHFKIGVFPNYRGHSPRIATGYFSRMLF